MSLLFFPDLYATSKESTIGNGRKKEEEKKCTHAISASRPLIFAGCEKEKKIRLEQIFSSFPREYNCYLWDGFDICTMNVYRFYCVKSDQSFLT